MSLNIQSHAQVSFDTFINSQNFSSQEEAATAVESFAAGWEACVDDLVNFANTSKEVPGLMRKKLAKALSDTRCITGGAPAIASLDIARLGWTACITYVNDFVQNSSEVPGMFRNKLINALSEVGTTPKI